MGRVVRVKKYVFLYYNSISEIVWREISEPVYNQSKNMPATMLEIGNALLYIRFHPNIERYEVRHLGEDWIAPNLGLHHTNPS